MLFELRPVALCLRGFRSLESVTCLCWLAPTKSSLGGDYGGGHPRTERQLVPKMD